LSVPDDWLLAKLTLIGIIASSLRVEISLGRRHWNVWELALNFGEVVGGDDPSEVSSFF